MTKRLLALANVLLLAAAVSLFLLPAVSSVQASPDDGANTEDILYLADGRILHGRIVEEKRDAIVFEIIMRGSSIRTKMTFAKADIEQVDRDVPTPDAPIGEKPKKAAGATSDPDEVESTYGAYRASAENENLPSFYIIPMKGQMGTDISTDVYEKMVDDIRALDPDIIVIEMECRDNEDVLYSLMGREERSLPDFDDFRKLAHLFRDELSDIRQVMWVHDSVGASSVVAMAWDELYMKPEARFGGLVALQELGFEKWADEDVRGKMTEAFMAWVKGLLEYGGYSHALADAMVRPKYMLSGTWKGREVEWALDDKGDYVVDASEDDVAEFRARTAENLCLSDGTAETLEDLALLLGIREFRVLEGKSEQMFEKYTKNWRRLLESCVEWLQDYEQYMGWASGDDAIANLGKAKSRLERVISAMERYKAVEVRLGMEHGIKKFDLETQVEVLEEQIRAMRG